jgi:hypothetical protein
MCDIMLLCVVGFGDGDSAGDEGKGLVMQKIES